ncbi:MAG: glutamate--tRNA ligase [Armatimonadota bacterium]|nr:glutamate--tRNA ligase [Armatimonadota bacterium]
MAGVRVRFAPSPTGDPHVGNIRSALFNWLFARHTGGEFILRIEDTDASRAQEGSAGAILECLQWLGLDYDEGPGVGGPHGPYYQSERRAIYAPLIKKLLDEDRAYRCYCSRDRLSALTEEQQLNKQATGYDRRCRSLSVSDRSELEHSETPYTIRLKVPLDGATVFRDRLRGEITFQNSTKTDPVLIKTDGMPVYHFANVVDDHLMGITHVLRAEEWISSTPIHVLLYNSFGWEMPEWVHLPLVLAPDKRKLSKRKGHAGTLEHRAEGFLPEAMFNFLSLLGWSPGEDREILSRNEIIELFNLDGLLTHGAVFDRTKLDWMNGEYIRSLPVEDLTDRCLPYLREAGFVTPDASTEERRYVEQVVGLARDRIKRLAEITDATRFFFELEPDIDEKARRKWLERPETKAVFQHFTRAIETAASFDSDTLEATARQVGEELGLETGSVFHPLRVALSGRTEGPGLFEMMEVLGRERTLQRLRFAADGGGALSI